MATNTHPETTGWAGANVALSTSAPAEIAVARAIGDDWDGLPVSGDDLAKMRFRITGSAL